MKQRVNSIWKWLSNLWRSFLKWATPAFYVGVIMIVKRVNSIWKWLSNLWRSFLKWATPTFYVGVIMIVISVILITFHNGILQAAGTAILAAGLTIITTTLTNRESIRRQNAKEANIIRKDAIYGPLFIELKQIYEWLDEAKKKEGRYPYYIFGAGGEPEGTESLHNPLYPTFHTWPQFKQDYRIDSFTLGARMLLDEAQRLIVDYNRAMGATMHPAVNVLAPHVEKALSAWMGSESFKEWDKRSSGGQVWQSDPLHYWNHFLKTQSVPLSEVSITLAKTWLGPYGGLGWLVAGAGDKAAMYIRNSQHTPPNNPAPDIYWFQGIINESWPELDNLQEIKEARVVAEVLQAKVREVKNLLESGIRFIRDQYEGGEPPV